MATRVHLSDQQWQRIEVFVQSDQVFGRRGGNDRNFIEAVLWWRRTGVPWRDLPDTFGPWKTVYNRFDRWAKNGRWKRLFEAIKLDGDNEWSSVDSTINRVHQHAAGAKGGPSDMRSVALGVD